MLGFKKRGGPTRPFSHATDCKILKADPGFEHRGRRSNRPLGRRNADAGRSTMARAAR